MAHIEQTKNGSRKSGGPQYYLQDVSPATRTMLDRFGRVPVRLWIPYGMIESRLTAVSSSVGRVGHDRIQSGGRVPSVADQIAGWFALTRANIERIEVDDHFDEEGMLVLLARRVKFFNKTRKQNLLYDSHPLTIIRTHRSPVLIEHLQDRSRFSKTCRVWIRDQISAIVADHKHNTKHLNEYDLLRASGALDKLGIQLGSYRSKGIDCPHASFTFDGFPTYACPVEIERNSSGFDAPHHRRAGHHKQRLVVLCMKHDSPGVLRPYVDIIEMIELERLLNDAA